MHVFGQWLCTDHAVMQIQKAVTENNAVTAI